MQHKPSICDCTGKCLCEGRNLALMQVLHPDSTSSLSNRALRHILHVRKTDDIVVAEITDISKKCICYASDQFQCVVDIPNVWEGS